MNPKIVGHNSVSTPVWVVFPQIKVSPKSKYVFSNKNDVADNPNPVGLGILLLLLLLILLLLLLLEKLAERTGFVMSRRILLSHVNTSPNSVINST